MALGDVDGPHGELEILIVLKNVEALSGPALCVSGVPEEAGSMETCRSARRSCCVTERTPPDLLVTEVAEPESVDLGTMALSTAASRPPRWGAARVDEVKAKIMATVAGVSCMMAVERKTGW